MFSTPYHLCVCVRVCVCVCVCVCLCVSLWLIVASIAVSKDRLKFQTYGLR